MTHDDTLSQFEIGTDPFTAKELAAISDYRKAINGVGDLVEGIEPKDLIRLGPGLDATGVRYLLAEMADGLNRWYLALDKALAELLTCTAGSTGHSVAAKRFLKFESSVYHQTRQAFEYAVTVFLLGRDNGPTGNYPPATFTVDLARQSLLGYS
ncbi:hypothetical protein [Actinacidiphila oryziradicis]|uniref:Uncharacterized protein n=1 Tax=Actinacidiphila oryziradicis TaxID=2571141 RepID=A0A4U0RZI8_9ACTN|nr:hypothetical protein [Actinacidiphila oryziradicis]TKA01168.1 hypothetical protein FCI23_40995 [Actinacidiphila oryziradicis]